jgi:hypothetical protein
MLEEHESSLLDDKYFKFVFYVSFQSRKDSIALDLMEGLQNLCTKFKRTNFELYIRLSNKESPRWDDSFIRT